MARVDRMQSLARSLYGGSYGSLPGSLQTLQWKYSGWNLSAQSYKTTQGSHKAQENRKEHNEVLSEDSQGWT